MKVLPTLHIQNGRLASFAGHEPVEGDPLAMATQLAGQGCCRLCLVDVDAARGGQGNNRDFIAEVIRRFRQDVPKACIQVGGGIRSSDHAQFYLDHGATWLLVGTILHRSPIVVDQLLGRFREHLTAAIDATSGKVQTSGWTESSSALPSEVARRIRHQGFRRILFSDMPALPDSIPDFETAALIVEHAKLPVLMGGSLRSQEHIFQARSISGLHGVLVPAHLVLKAPEMLGTSAQPCA